MDKNEKTPFISIFGKLQPVEEKKPKPKKIKTQSIIKNVEYIYLHEAVYCKDRIDNDDNNILCCKPDCNCEMKKYEKVKSILWANQGLIYEAIKNKLTDYDKKILDWDWNIPNTNMRKAIYRYINKKNIECNLNLIRLAPYGNEKIITALDAYHCENRVKDIICCCKCIDINYRESVLNCMCYFMEMTNEDLLFEASREILYQLLKDKRLTKWDRVALSFDLTGNKMSNKQIKVWNNFLTKYHEKYPNLAKDVDLIRTKQKTIQEVKESMKP